MPNGGPDPNSEKAAQEPNSYVANWDTGRINFNDMFENDRKRRSDDCSDFDGKFNHFYGGTRAQQELQKTV